MNLRVFLDTKGKLRVEVSSQYLRSARGLFVPMVPATMPTLAYIDPNHFVSVRYREEAYRVPFLLLRSLTFHSAGSPQEERLDETDSRNILNIIIDILGYIWL